MKKLQYVQSFEQGGETYNYLRYKKQSRVKLPGKLGSREFMAAYNAALAAAKAADKERAPRVPAVKKSVGGTLRANIERYLQSALFKSLEPSTQDLRRRTLVRWCEGDREKGVEGYGDITLATLTPAAFKTMMYAREHAPGAQRHFLCTVRHLIKDCKKAGAVADDFDPTAGSKAGRGQSKDGIKCWPVEHVETFRRYWAPGTKARRAFELLYASGAACVDVVKLGPSNITIEDGVQLIAYQRQKTGADACRLYTAELDAELSLSKIQALPGTPWLLNAEGRPYAERHFGEQFRRWAQEAGVPKGFSAHGVRKRAATDSAMAGTHVRVLMAEFGWTDIEHAEVYTRQFDAKKGVAALAKRVAAG